MTHSHETVTCQICHKTVNRRDAFPAALVRPVVVDSILKVFPEWSSTGYICADDHNRFRTQHVAELLRTERGELDSLEQDVVRSLQEQEIIAQNVNEEFATHLTLGERVSDRIAAFGGSWRFISLFGFILFAWIAANTVLLLRRPFDPFPFILLNLILSCIAAIQAPVIMMSQNRQESKDRLRAEHDYRVNLKAELEIRHLNQRIDHLLSHQWERLVEIQQIQTEMMQEIARLRPTA